MYSLFWWILCYQNIVHFIFWYVDALFGKVMLCNFHKNVHLTLWLLVLFFFYLSMQVPTLPRLLVTLMPTLIVLVVGSAWRLAAAALAASFLQAQAWTTQDLVAQHLVRDWYTTAKHASRIYPTPRWSPQFLCICQVPRKISRRSHRRHTTISLHRHQPMDKHHPYRCQHTSRCQTLIPPKKVYLGCQQAPQELQPTTLHLLKFSPNHPQSLYLPDQCRQFWTTIPVFLIHQAYFAPQRRLVSHTSRPVFRPGSRILRSRRWVTASAILLLPKCSCQL